MNQHLYNSKQMRSVYSISKATLNRRLAQGVIPAPLKINGRNYWSAEVINQHIDELIGGLSHADESQ